MLHSMLLHEILLIIIWCLNITKSYKLWTKAYDFNGAVSFCESRYNSSLATISKFEENRIVSKLCLSNGSINCWIGLHKNINNNNWYWIQNNNTNNFSEWSNASYSNSKHCVEIIADNKYNGEWKKISCSKLRYPICNDPVISNDLLISPLIQFNHNRKILQEQTISCTEYNNKTCFIHHNQSSLEWINKSIECDPNYSNCNIAVYYARSSIIHCPKNDCDSCFIYYLDYNQWDDSVKYTEIKGYHCKLLMIVVTGYFVHNIVEAPDNGGKLEIIAVGSGRAFHNLFLSSPGTANMNIFVHGNAWFYYNNISGGNLTGNLIFSCIENAWCPLNNIICDGYNTGCYINCSSVYYQGGCWSLTVYVTERTSDIDWYCDNSQGKECLNAMLKCNNISNPKYSEWQYDDINKWHYKTGDCVQNWITPIVSCTFKRSDTCFINKQYMESSRDIRCSDDIINCEVFLGDKDTKKQWQTSLHSIVDCPSSKCEKCSIDCIDEYSCIGITIRGYNCSLLEINIRAIQADFVDFWTTNATIYAPGNGGELVISTNFEQGFVSFRGSRIYSSPGTKNIILDFDQCDWVCWGNFIDGTHVTNDLNVTCSGYGNCGWSEIICPNDANCNIDCTATTTPDGYDGGCRGMTVRAVEGTHDVNWFCDDDDPWSCKEAILYCNNNFSQSSAMQYVNGSKWKLENNSNGCVNMSTIAPSAFPTIPSAPPTVPSETPTAAPLQIEKQNAFIQPMQLGAIAGAAVFIFILIVCGLMYYYKVYKPEKKALYIRKGLVILIGIGEYDEEVENDEIGGYLRNLCGIDHDITNMVHLFHDKLNYDIYPSEYLDVINKGYSPKQHWTEQELNTFLVERAKYLEENIEKYDGLIVIISGHGVPGNICTSDYKKFSKLAVHRTFSAAHPKSREIPRVFLFDCCSGSKKQELRRYPTVCDEEKEDKKEEKDENEDIGKEIGSNNVAGDGVSDRPWIRGEHNPDYRLALIEAANPGFQSKLRSDVGSYVIYSFYKRTMDILTSNKRRFIHKMFDEIQNELENLGKQHPICTWNNNTRYIRFEKNNDERKESATDNEMVHLNS